jgi:FAD:protein FMN transferase
VITRQRVEAHRFTAFGGSRCEILACDVEAAHLSMCVAEVYAFEQRLTRFSPDSELSRFNAAAGTRVAVSPLLEELLRTALDAWARTDGLVNAAVLPALIAAGYDRSIEQVRNSPSPPHPVGKNSPSPLHPNWKDSPNLLHPNWKNSPSSPHPPSESSPIPPLPEVLHVGDGWARLAAGCAIDLGGVGKGWLADRLGERLGNAVANLGGDLCAIGDGPDGAGWTVGLCDGSVLALRDGGVATSGIEVRRWRGGHHLVDPRTGVPAATDLLAVSVVAADAATAEALAKAAALLGSHDAPQWLRDHGAARWAMRSEGRQLSPETA